MPYEVLDYDHYLEGVDTLRTLKKDGEEIEIPEYIKFTEYYKDPVYDGDYNKDYIKELQSVV